MHASSSGAAPPSHRTRRTRLRRAATAMALATVALVGPTALPPSPASAIAVSTLVTTTTPATWVDGQGRQYEVVSTTGGTLNIARDAATGVPDTTWGPQGMRGLALTPPVSGAGLPRQVAVSDSGILTVAFTEPGCSEDSTCDRLFARFDGATGAGVGTPVTVPDERAVFRALDDGSVLLGTTDTALRWYGADGAPRAVPGITGAQLDGADIDATGRLLVLATDGTLTRWPVTKGSGTADLTLAAGCGAEMQGGAVGAAPDGGFAVVCFEAGAVGLTTTRYAATGAVNWAIPGTTSGVYSVPVQRVTVDATDRVWYGGGYHGFAWIISAPGKVLVSSTTSAGPGPVAYSRGTGTNTQGQYPSADVTGTGITDLRTTADGAHVAVADLKLCCQFPSNFSPSTSAFGEVLPIRPGPPRCAVSVSAMTQSADGDVHLVFGACADGRPNARPTGYRVEATGPAGTATTTVEDPGAGHAATAVLHGLTAGERSTVTVTPFNAQGDTTVPVAPITTILPFGGIYDFVGYQAQTLGGAPLSVDDRYAYTNAITAQTLSPGAFMEEIIGDGTARIAVEPAARLYRAAFLRDPDIGGLRYWVGKRRTGVRVAAIAEQFVRSSEFQRRYGTLSNRAFVSRIYQNVLGRPGDPAGIDFWTKRLDSKQASRGSLLASFSESSEFIRKTNGIVQPLTVTFLMVDRLPTAAERATWSGSDAVYADMPETILATAEYVARVAAR